ncbi:Hypothetical predicted protein, partial [Xyrichtys novacula]
MQRKFEPCICSARCLYVNDESSETYWQESVCCHDVFIHRPALVFFISSETAETEEEEEEEAASPSCPTCPTSPIVALPPHPPFFSTGVLRPRRKCAVSPSVLFSLHSGADGLVMPAQPHQSDTDVPATPSATITATSPSEGANPAPPPSPPYWMLS